MKTITCDELLRRLKAQANERQAGNLQRFFKTGPGEYGEGDIFIGLSVPQIRGIVRDVKNGVEPAAAFRLLDSEIHEARMLGLFLLVWLFERGDEAAQRDIYRRYLASTARINNWDLVDLSAPNIVGGWLATRDRAVLYRLARSKNLWERRIAVLATFTFIRRGEFDDILRLAEMLLGDRHDLMHKAVGWMLREVAKRDERVLEAFLERHVSAMPRTMLRYAIERFPEPRRKAWLAR